MADQKDGGGKGRKIDIPATGDKGRKVNIPAAGDKGRKVDLPDTGDKGRKVDIPGAGGDDRKIEIPATDDKPKKGIKLNILESFLKKDSSDDGTKKITLPFNLKKSGKEKPSEETVVFSDKALPGGGAQSKGKEETQFMPVLGQKGKRASIFVAREKKPNFVLGVFLTVVKLIFVAIIVFVAAGFGSVIGVAEAYLETTPELDTGKIEDQSLTSYIYDQQGNLLVTYSGAENRDWASIDEIPTDLQNAVIAVEDIRFRTHDGIDIRRLAGAFVSNLSSSKVEGGSTITQQLIKNKLLSNEKSYKRKLQEAFLATELERKYTKDEILEAYLNSIPLGGRVYGVKTAAKDYFGKEMSQLTLKEMVCIAAITQSTTKFNPRRATYTNTDDLPYLINRMNIITERMWWNGMITEDQYNETYIPSSEYLSDESVLDDDGSGKELILASGYLQKWKVEMNILEESPANATYKYPHFVEYVIQDVQNFMLEQQGLEDTSANRLIVDREMRAGGYKIYATIDTKIQETVQASLEEWDQYPDFRKASDAVTIDKDNNGNPIEIIQPQAAAVVIENETGYLRAIVGSRTTPDSMLTFNRASEGTMQIGSSMKPIGVYGPAFDTGYGLASSVGNIPVPITGWEVTDDDPGYPKTSHGSGGYGPVSMHEAIVSSLNIAAARTQADYVGTETSLYYLERLGVDTSKFVDEATGIDNRGIVGLALGSAPVTPLELTGAYSVIPRGGEYLQPISFTRVEDSQNNVVIDATQEREQHQAFKATTAWMLNTALEDAVDHGTGTRAKIEGMTTAGKTGTVVQNKGACFAGYTPYYTSALWVGHDLYKSFESGDGGRICAPLWNDYMTKIHEGKTDKAIFSVAPESLGLVEATLCSYSNMKASGACGSTSTDWIAAADVPVTECDWCGGGSGHWFCADSNMLAGPYCPESSKAYRSTRNFPIDSPYYLWSGGSASASTVEQVDPETGETVHVAAPLGDTSQTCNIHTESWYWASAVPAEPVAPVETTDPAAPTEQPVEPQPEQPAEQQPVDPPPA